MRRSLFLLLAIAAVAVPGCSSSSARGDSPLDAGAEAPGTSQPEGGATDSQGPGFDGAAEPPPDVTHPDEADADGDSEPTVSSDA